MWLKKHKIKLFVVLLVLINLMHDKKNGQQGLISNEGGYKITYGLFIVIECVYILLASLSYWFDVIGRLAWYFEVFETLFFAHQFSKKSNSIYIAIARLLLIVIAITKFKGNFSVIEMRFPFEFFWQNGY